MANYVIGVTGASGSVYGQRVVQALLAEGHCVHLVVSAPGRRVILQELGLEFPADAEGPVLPGGALDNLWRVFAAGGLRHQTGTGQADGRGIEAGNLVLHSPDNIGATIASGSFPVDGMAIVPCSMATVAGLASGTSRNLIERSADVAVKEGRPLVVVPRETPLSAIHLENLLKLARLGVRIVPAMPAFYNRPKSVSEIVGFVAGRALSSLGLEGNPLVNPWQG